MTKLKQFVGRWFNFSKTESSRSLAKRDCSKDVLVVLLHKSWNFCSTAKSGVWSGSGGSSLNHTKLPSRLWISGVLSALIWTLNKQKLRYFRNLNTEFKDNIETLALEICNLFWHQNWEGSDVRRGKLRPQFPHHTTSVHSLRPLSVRCYAVLPATSSMQWPPKSIAGIFLGHHIANHLS